MVSFFVLFAFVYLPLLSFIQKLLFIRFFGTIRRTLRIKVFHLLQFFRGYLRDVANE